MEVGFTTTREFLREALPPCFEVPDEPRACVRFGTSDGGGMTFNSCSIFVTGMFGDVLGWYDLSMLFTGDMTVTMGREVWGESKKRAKVVIDSTLPSVHGYAERNGVRLVEVEASGIDADLGPRTTQSRTFLHLKAYLNSDATDLSGTRSCSSCRAPSSTILITEGSATLTLRSSDWDSCGTIPVVSVNKVTWGHYRISYQHSQQQLSGREGYLPYVIGRSYDHSHTPD